ncbi:hypothetical protein [Billgrantia endophytica]|uniref:Uncharacterized protein n=1 Tax=Billgrantia endophytica TaxID=2033802 RepID=A0A2N7TWZ1_9GAMM|nr:hypothetical protein [Halomonas endophytica]PMR72713.1 hypothetical protein C1H69_19890 [Halomonas endophytica]
MTAMQGYLAALTILRDAVDALETPCLHEQSVKLRPSYWGEQRVLYSVPLSRQPSRVLTERLEALLTQWQMPAVDQQQVLSGPDDDAAGKQPLHYLHLGLEGDRCKVYWEYPLPSSAAEAGERHVQYRAWKWRPGQTRAAQSEYVLLPTATSARGAIRQQLELLPPLVADLVEQLEISTALMQHPWPPMTVRIEEAQAGNATPRDSINLHMHQSRLPLGTIAGLLMALARDWQSAPRDTLVQWMVQHGNQMLGNVSFGLGGDRQPFFTCYYAGQRLAGQRRSVPNDNLSPTR